MAMTRPLAVLLFLCCANAMAEGPKKPVPTPKPKAAVSCASAPLFQRYARLGWVEALPDGRVRLSVVLDAHGADCGTGDCYFTTVKALFRFSGDGGCRVQDVDVWSQEEVHCELKDRPQEPPSKPQQEVFVPKGAANLSDPKLTKLTLRTRKGDRAFVILPENLFFFEDVKPGAPLHTTLPSDDDDESECCWGASIASSHFLPLYEDGK
ncbi:hypothetical protein D7Y13_15650 [Corallococcus praedator]|uniref:Uncharacterized protein n=2 Tax=Myxococcaceae TaxID=31 RepID=A0ABX9QIU1_9BACT|nr:hypothetical protein D7X75_19950 [Corallococcus sp. CA031C]RKI08584.1 hypothetical protein D7Y13_15650 [Corallococcus praedator]